MKLSIRSLGSTWLGMFLLTFFVGLCAPASAYYLPLLFDPTAPAQGQVAQAIIRVGDCDFVQVFGAQDRQIVLSDNTLRVTINGHNEFSEPFCIYPDVTTRVELIPLLAGTYHVELYRREINDPTDVALVSEGDLVVGPPVAPPSAVPSLGYIAVGTLGLLVGMVGLNLRGA